MNIEEIFKESCAKLTHHKIENPALNIGFILEEITGIKRLSLPLFYKNELDENQIVLVRNMLKKRCNNEPLQYILGYTEFYGYKFKVTPDVLIPRPETEYLIEAIEKNIKNNQRIIDIGTGSGAIAITLKKLFPQAEVVAVDISPHALKIARENALLNEVDVKFVEANIYSDELGKFDLIVSNPPYVTEEEYSILPEEVKNFEPKLALVGEETGLFFYRKIIELSTRILSPNGSLFFEIGENQAKDIKNIAQANDFKQVEIIQDLVERERIMLINN